MSELVIKTDLQKSLDIINVFKDQIDLIGADCSRIKVKDELTLAIAQQNLSKASQMAKFIEDKRVLVKAPYLADCKVIDSTCKKIVEVLEKGITHIKSEVKNWEIEKQNKEKEKQDAIDAQLAADKASMESMPLTEDVVDKYNELQISADAQKELVSSGKTRGIRYQWKFELVFKTDLPMEWIALDESAVKEYIKENKEMKEGTINGVRFYKDIIVTA